MLTGVYQIGEYILSTEDDSYISIIENPRERGDYKHVIKIVFTKKNQKLVYTCVDYEEFSDDRIKRYAYKKADGANAGDHTPTSILNIKNPDKTLRNIMKPIKRLINSMEDKKNKDYLMFDNLYKQMEDQFCTIEAHIILKIKSLNLPRNEGAIITIVIIDSGDENYIGDFQIITKHLEEINDERFFKKYGKESRGDAKCYYCNEEKEVLGFVNTFNFYTVDKKSFVTGGFKQEESWINYPVCLECAHILEIGKKYINKNLRSKFSGFNYCVIPKVIIPENTVKEEMHNILTEFEGTGFSTSEDIKNNLLNSEDYFIELMQNYDNNMNYNIMIYKEENAAFRILLLIEDVVPSRIKNILREKERLEKDYSQNIFDYLYDNQFSFAKIRYFFPNNKEEGNFDKAFLEILNNIFKGRQINYHLFLEKIMNKTSWLFSKEENYYSSVLQGLMCILFIQRLKLFSNKKEGTDKAMMDISEKKLRYIDFFTTNKEIFDSSAKKAAFLVGVLTNKLMNIQFVDKNSKPFYSRLNGLNLDEKLLKRIYVEAINKLNEYNKNYYITLEEVIAEYMLKPINLTDNEISFYFALGLSLSSKFKSENKEVEGEDNYD